MARPLLLFVGVAVLLAGCAPVFKGGEESYEIEGAVSSVRVENFAGDIEVVSGMGVGARVVETYEYTKDRPRTRHSVSGGELALVHSGCEGALEYDKCGVSYRIEVPASTAVRLVTGGGDITVALDSPPGVIDARTGGGDVDVRLPSGTSYVVDAVTGAGDRNVGVRTDSASPRKVSVRSGGGDVRVGYGES